MILAESEMLFFVMTLVSLIIRLMFLIDDSTVFVSFDPQLSDECQS